MPPRSRARTALIRAALAVAVVLVVLLVADVAVTRYVERRVGDELAAGVGAPVSLRLGGWPVSLRLLDGRVPRAEVSFVGARDVEELTVVLSDVEVDVADLLDSREPTVLAARQADVALTLAGMRVLGARRMQATLLNLDGSLGASHSTVRMGSAHINSAGGAAVQQGWWRARLREVALELLHDGHGQADVAVQVTQGELTADRHDGRDALPMDAAQLRLSFADGHGRFPDGQPVLGAGHADVRASDVAVTGDAGRLGRVAAALPDLLVDRPGGGVGLTVVRTSDGRFATELDQAQVNELWPLPGEIRLLDGAASLVAGEAAVEFDVWASDGRVVFSLEVPANLQDLLGETASLAVTPRLPGDAVLEDVRIVPGALRVYGSATRLELPG